MKGPRDGKEKKIVGVGKIRSFGIITRALAISREGEGEESAKTLDLFLENGISRIRS